MFIIMHCFTSTDRMLLIRLHSKGGAIVVNINIVVLRPFSNSNQPFSFSIHSSDFTFKFHLFGNHPFTPMEITPLVQRKHTTIASHHLAISFVSLYTITQHLYLPFRSVKLFTCVYVYITM